MITVVNRVAQKWSRMTMKHISGERRQIASQMLSGEMKSNGNDQKPTLRWKAQVSLMFTTICRAKMSRTQSNSMIEREKWTKTWTIDGNSCRSSIVEEEEEMKLMFFLLVLISKYSFTQWTEQSSDSFIRTGSVKRKKQTCHRATILTVQVTHSLRNNRMVAKNVRYG